MAWSEKAVKVAVEVYNNHNPFLTRMDHGEALLSALDAAAAVDGGSKAERDSILDEAIAALEPFEAAIAKIDKSQEEHRLLGMGELSDNASTGFGIKFSHIRNVAALLTKLRAARNG